MRNMATLASHDAGIGVKTEEEALGMSVIGQRTHAVRERLVVSMDEALVIAPSCPAVVHVLVPVASKDGSKK